MLSVSCRSESSDRAVADNSRIARDRPICVSNVVLYKNCVALAKMLNNGAKIDEG